MSIISTFHNRLSSGTSHIRPTFSPTFLKRYRGPLPGKESHKHERGVKIEVKVGVTFVEANEGGRH